MKPSSNARIADPDTARRNAYQAVVARPFTRICKRQTWEQKESFLGEARETSMIFDQVSYYLCGEQLVRQIRDPS